MRQTLHFASHEACETLTATVADHSLVASHGARRKQYASGSAIWTPADLPDRVFRLHAGRVHIVAVNAEGQEHLYRAVVPGEIFGEMCFCADRHEPHGSFARCLGRSDVSATSFLDFKRRLRDDGSLVDGVIQRFAAASPRRNAVSRFSPAGMRENGWRVSSSIWRRPGCQPPANPMAARC